ncbi:TetR/AcrR family transcriptional regulator [Paenibacillus lignilyticus]|uniref:TetR/AcrR family transcriptional regulator n=1 Tax=Paenibacillus lignilyticus TaxID=1172615 RepID=A0ABS5CM72_9BACL|nr:TetR/AcrR family transcriptional regulator [Paenibacillus lignilyticus]MBP3966950.1 TetR/AcrR family transcriptional regulator [Paenibacillus lignilyticus]
MSPKTDPRIERTKDMLRSALIELIEEKGFESITVRDLTLKAGLNRGTFYLHYHDKFDLLEQCKSEIWRGFEERIQHANPELLLQYVERDEAYPFMVDVFRFLRENGDFFRVMMGPKGDPSFNLRYKELMLKHLYNKLMLLQPEDHKLLVPRDFLTAYIISANFGVMQHWLETGMVHTPHEMALIISRIMRRGPLRMTGVLDG